MSDEKKRLTIHMPMSSYNKLRALAGGERKLGEYITQMVEAASALDVPDRLDLEILRDRLYALSGRVSSLEAESTDTRRTVAALIADN